MKKGILLYIIAFFTLLLFPNEAFAIDYTINQTKIDAYLQADGNAHVEETYTYTFDGDFNGITRTIIPKRNTEIINFKANEFQRALNVEQDDNMYLIYRSGESEQIKIHLSYEIVNAVEVYEDMAQFYWPFFDSNNESDYQNLTITVHPPQGASETIAIGYDAAYDTEIVQSNGITEFNLDKFESGSKGDIRVAYNQSLFPGAHKQEGAIRQSLIDEKAKLEQKQITFIERQTGLKNSAPYIIISLSLLFISINIYAWRRKQLVKLEVERLSPATSFVPDLVLSMPATLYYYNNFYLSASESLTVGMMDLVRKGNITEEEDGTYYLADKKTDHQHEKELIDFLFTKIGHNRQFTFEQLENFMADSKNEEDFILHQHKYYKLLKEEIASLELFDQHYTLRWTTIIIGILLIPYTILLGIHDIIMWMGVAFILIFVFASFGFIYKPKTAQGIQIKESWKTFKKNYEDMDTVSFLKLSDSEKEHALIFASGFNDDKLTAQNKLFTEQLTMNQSATQNTAILFMLLTLSTAGHREFSSSTQHVSAYDGGSSGGGTGVGGGGGGSGAF